MQTLSSLARSTFLAGFSLSCVLGCSVDITVDYSGDGENGGTGGANGGQGGVGNQSSGGTGATASGGTGAGAIVGCNGLLCEPLPPAGWQGFAYVAGESNADPTPVGPTCPDGSSPQTYFTTPSGAAECSPCTCGALANVGCNVPLLCSSAKGCGSPTNMTLNDGDCSAETGTVPASCYLGTPQVTSQGACPASGGQLAAGLPFEQVAHVCVADSPGSCTSGGACVTPGKDQYSGYICIYQVGEKSCPGEYPTQIVTYKQPIDNRACTPCSCTPMVAGCTTGAYKFFHDGLCVVDGPDITATSCSDITVYKTLGTFGYERTIAPTGMGSCAVAGGVAQGEAKGDPAQAITYCCKNP
jgi:hypothetical protein